MATSGYVGLPAESDGLGIFSMTLSIFSGLELSEAEGPAFGSKRNLSFFALLFSHSVPSLNINTNLLSCNYPKGPE